MKVDVEDTYAEAFDGLYFRILVTAEDEFILRRSAEDATATPSIVLGRIEGGIEKYIRKEETPDKRPGVILQFWSGLDKLKSLNDTIDKFYKEFSYRIRQDILVKPFTAVFDVCKKSVDRIDAMDRIGHCGDGYEWIENCHGRDMIIVPTMVPDFMIEHYLGYGKGVIGGNFWYMCETKRSLFEAGKRAMKAIHNIDEVIIPFDICSAGSKAETVFPHIGPTTNHLYCPSLKKRLGEKSKVPNNVRYIPEIVINGTTLDAVKNAIKSGIQAVSEVEGIVKISAGNYGGKLGKYKLFLREMLS